MAKSKIAVSVVEGVSRTPTLQTSSQTTVERFVAFLDIMGFKDRVARNSHTAVLRQLESFQNIIAGYVAEVKASNIRVALFSDSVMLFSNDTREESLEAIAAVISRIMLSALQQDVPIPLKGAIAKGEVTCNEAKQLYFGQALIDAYSLEESVKYYGVLVHHTAEADARKIRKYFRKADAYLRCGRVSHYELNWYLGAKKVSASKSVEQCLEALRLTVSDEPRRYIDNTLTMYEDQRNTLPASKQRKRI